jgi:hypothetical protein
MQWFVDDLEEFTVLLLLWLWSSWLRYLKLLYCTVGA